MERLQEPKKEALEEKEIAAAASQEQVLSSPEFISIQYFIWSYHQEMEAPAVDLRAVRPPKADIQNKENKTCSVCQVGAPTDMSH